MKKVGGGEGVRECISLSGTHPILLLNSSFAWKLIQLNYADNFQKQDIFLTYFLKKIVNT